MSKKKVTFGQIHRLLTGYGFVRTPVEEKAVFYENTAGDTIIFRPHRLGEEVDPVNLSMVQHRLDWYGLLEHAKFEDALNKAATKRRVKPKKK